MGLLLAIQGAISEGVLWGIMAIGVFITYSILNFSDLTVDGSFALGGVSCAVFIVGGTNPVLSLLFASILGMFSGIVTGLLNTKLKIPGILSSILTMISLYSINMRIAKQQANIPFMKSENVFSLVEQTFHLSRPTAVLVVGLVVAVAVIAFLYWFFGTEVGCAIRATGNNEHMARALGVNTDAMKIIGLMVSNGIVALSGALVAQNDRVGNVGMGTGTIVIGLAAVVIGTAFIKNDKNFSLRFAATVIGSVIYRVIIAIVLQANVVIKIGDFKLKSPIRTDDQKLITAIIVIIALGYPHFKEKLASRKRAKEAAKC